MPWTFWFIELSTYLFAVWLFGHARRQPEGSWTGTLLWGMAFGVGVELAIVSGTDPSYEYGRFLVMLGPANAQVPLWVGVGWGAILYAATWTAHKLKQPWFLRPITAAVLAVNIDLSLDPVAQHQGFWKWDQADDPNLYGVPFDNFLGWFLIVAVYSGCVRGLFRIVPRGTWGAAAWVPGLAALLAVLLFLVLRATLPPLYDGLGGEAIVFALVSLLGGVLAWRYVLDSRRDQPWSLAILAIPIWYHASLLGMVLVERIYEAPGCGSLLVLLPANLLLGAFAYAWVSIDKLLPARG